MNFAKAFLGLALILGGATSASATPCDNSCSSDCRKYFDGLVVAAAQIGRNCGWQSNEQPISRSVEMYRSDSCSGDFLGFLQSGTNCAALASLRVWAIKVNGECINFSDMDGDKACLLYKAAANPASVALYYSDSCGAGNLLAFVDSNTNCTKLNEIENHRVWAVRGGGGTGDCQNISDMDFLEGCRRFQ
jgi:hypothetical protein